ncbi:MAG: peroxidase-related enzyme, partial [Planctomycetaceae bacterium]
GPIKRLYDAAVQRAGRVFNILKLMSLRPRIAQSSIQFYSAIMHGESPLSRGQRERLATVVSRANTCYY